MRASLACYHNLTKIIQKIITGHQQDNTIEGSLIIFPFSNNNIEEMHKQKYFCGASGSM